MQTWCSPWPPAQPPHYREAGNLLSKETEQAGKEELAAKQSWDLEGDPFRPAPACSLALSPPITPICSLPILPDCSQPPSPRRGNSSWVSTQAYKQTQRITRHRETNNLHSFIQQIATDQHGKVPISDLSPWETSMNKAAPSDALTSSILVGVVYPYNEIVFGHKKE